MHRDCRFESYAEPFSCKPLPTQNQNIDHFSPIDQIVVSVHLNTINRTDTLEIG